jgi:hypothetical protein
LATLILYLVTVPYFSFELITRMMGPRIILTKLMQAVMARERKVLDHPFLSSALGRFLKYFTWAYLRLRIIPKEQPSMKTVAILVISLVLNFVSIVVPRFSHKMSKGSDGSSTIGTFPPIF